MAEKRSAGLGAVVRVFTQQPNRVAAAWRRARFQLAAKGTVPDNLLDDVVESFVREVGHALGGTPGCPWSRARGVLRISPVRGAHALYDEFAVLRRCLTDAVDVLGGGQAERALVNTAVDEAVDSAIATCRRMTDPRARPPEVPFGGLVVEIFERPFAPTASAAATPQVH